MGKREFKIGDRVKVYYHGKWWHGEIHSFRPGTDKKPKWLFKKYGGRIDYKIVSEDEKFVVYEYPGLTFMYIKTYEKIGADDDLFEGYGLRWQVWERRPPTSVIHEDEPEPDMSPKAIDPLDDDLPF